MITTSLVSRAMRSTELRITGVDLDHNARILLEENGNRTVRLIARKRRPETEESLDQADREVRFAHNIGEDERLYFFEVERGDASDFEDRITVCGERVGRHVLFCVSSPAVANAVAAVLIQMEQRTGQVPHAYVEWTEGNPVGNLFRFLFLGEGDVAPLTHEVLRRAIPDPKHRPVIHVS
jgi:hypothetical protein